MMEALLSFFRRQVGLRTDAASATGSLHSKVRDIAEKDTIKNGSIKSIQRGTLVLSTSLSADATISSVNTSKAMLNFLGASSISAAKSGVPVTGHHFVRLTLTNGTTITATREVHNSTAAIVSYEVIEFY